MPTVQIQSPNSVRKQALFLPGRKIYAQQEDDRPGLQDEIKLLPLSILEIFRSLIKPGITNTQLIHLGGGVSQSGNTIVTRPEWIIQDDAVYYIEPFTLNITEAARWGFFEIKLEDQEGEQVGLDFWDAALDRAEFRPANTKTLNKVLINENYSATPEFPSVSPGHSKWIEYKKDVAGSLGELQSIIHLPSQNVSLHTPGLQSQVARGITTGRVIPSQTGSPILTPGTYDVNNAAVDLVNDIPIAVSHNYGSASLRQQSWYLLLLSSAGEVRTQLYVKTRLLENVTINEIERVQDDQARLYVPNSIDLSLLTSSKVTEGILIHITGAAQPSNNGIFEIISVDDTDDSSGTTGFKEIHIKNTYISRETEEEQVNLNAVIYDVPFAGSSISNPEITFQNSLNGYYSDILVNHRILGIFYTDATSEVSYIYSLASGREWIGGIGKNIGTIYPVFTDREPPWGLIANGAEVAKANYPELYSVIGDNFGTPSDNTMFTLPDVRGRFIRFMNLGSGTDPDVSSRTRGSDTGDMPGSLQSHAMQGHRHNDSGHRHDSNPCDTPGGADNAGRANRFLGLANVPSIDLHVNTTTGRSQLGDPVSHNNGNVEVSDENRPINVSMMPIIKF